MNTTTYTINAATGNYPTTTHEAAVNNGESEMHAAGLIANGWRQTHDNGNMICLARNNATVVITRTHGSVQYTQG
jgi:hypothetical protein